MQKDYDNCKSFDSIYCPQRNTEMMKDLIFKTTIMPDIPTDLNEGLMIADKVNELICSKCDSFSQIASKR
jgi:hypothetical protein